MGISIEWEDDGEYTPTSGPVQAPDVRRELSLKELEQADLTKHLESQRRSAKRRHIASGGAIPYHAEWEFFPEKFWEAAGARPSPYHTFGPLDSDKGFVPGNVGWRTAIEVEAARGAVIVTDTDGQQLTLAQLANKHGLQVSMIKQRHKTCGGDVARLLSEGRLNAKRDVPYMGVMVTISELAILTGVSQYTLRSRWEKGVRGPALVAPAGAKGRNHWSAEAQARQEQQRLAKREALMQRLSLVTTCDTNTED